MNSYRVKKLFVLLIISIIKSAFLLVAIYFYLLPFLPFFYLVTSNCFSPKAICFVRVLMTSRRKRSILTRYEHIKYMNQSRTFYFHVPVPIKELCKSSLCITPGFIRGKECRQGTKLCKSFPIRAHNDLNHQKDISRQTQFHAQ